MEFGELIEPSTRAFWEDYDEPNADLTAEPKWKWMDDDLETDHAIAPFKRFYVIEGKQIFDFVQKTTLKGALPICQLDSQKTAIYSFIENDYAICLTEGNDLNTTGQITDLLKPWLEKATETIAISFQPAYSYNTQKKFDKRCFVRSIDGGQNKVNGRGLDYVKPLEDCNIVHGISAGVSSWRHLNDKNFNCFVVYIECPAIDSSVSGPILKLFGDVGIKCDTKYTHSFANNSNLYI